MRRIHYALALILAFQFQGMAQSSESPSITAATRPASTGAGKSDSLITGKADSTGNGNTDPASHPKPKHAHLDLAVNYQSDNVYLGRKDSARLPYIIPMLTYTFRSGLYFSAAASWLNDGTNNRIDVVTLEGGYSFTAGDYEGEITASKLFYNSQSTSVTSDIMGSVMYQNGYDFGFIKPTVGLTMDIGSHIDVQGAFGLEHSFDAFDDKLEFTPTFVANASTLNYYSNYFKKKRFSKRSGKKTIKGTEDITGTVINASAFRIMDYEMSLPISYTLGKLTLSFTPTYAMPVHAAIVQVTTVPSVGKSTTKTTVEQLENHFYFTAGVSWRF